MALTIRPIESAEFGLYRKVLGIGMGIDFPEEELESARSGFELERSACAFEDGNLIGTLATISLELTLPGGRAPMAGTTQVAVLPTHRRRGVMREMMRTHLFAARDRKDVFAGLWASESALYGRFGYGVAAHQNEIAADVRLAELSDAPRGKGTVRFVSAEEAAQILPALYERVRPQIPGMLSRSSWWWQRRRLHDPRDKRGGASAYLFAIYYEGNEPRGYLQYRRTSDWHGNLPEDQIRVAELIGLDAIAEAELWRFAFSVDLVAHVRAWNRPADDPLLLWVNEPRRVRQLIQDSLWLRPLDVAAALESRRYAVNGKLKIAVRDPICSFNEAVFELDGGPEGARCRRSNDAPEITLSVSALGSVMLGGVSFQRLARAGAIDGDPERTRFADAMFLAPRHPWCPDKF